MVLLQTKRYSFFSLFFDFLVSQNLILIEARDQVTFLMNFSQFIINLNLEAIDLCVSHFFYQVMLFCLYHNHVLSHFLLLETLKLLNHNDASYFRKVKIIDYKVFVTFTSFFFNHLFLLLV